MPDECILELRSVVHRYRAAEAAAVVASGARANALDGASLRVHAGRRLAILGGNGAGKSTLLLHMNGTLQPHEGNVLWMGRTVDRSRQGIRRLREGVGLVFQEPDEQLFAGTVAQDVSFGPLNMGLERAEVEARVAAALGAVGLSEFGDLPPHMLSHGQRRRAAIAGVLAMEPDVLVLDEPTAGLDPRGVGGLLERLDDFLSLRRAVVFATHDVALARDWADDAALLLDGRVAAFGPAGDILSDEELLRTCGLLSERGRECRNLSSGDAGPSRLLVLTGDGKGKTSSAAGMLLRAVGHGHAAVLIRFIKARPSAEIGVLRDVGVRVAGGGRGFLPSDSSSSAFARHADAARAAWDDARRILSTTESPALVVLDEVCVALSRGVLDHDAVREGLSLRRPGVSVVCTGRGAPEWLRDMADTVSEVECRRHALQDGIPATKGVEL